MTESAEIRSSALAVMLTWRPSESWWSNIASMTWWEKSHDFLSFVSSTFKSVASGSDIEQ